MKQYYKISFCTVTMNRLHHLRETLPVNLVDNTNYPNAEFLILDYNSTDGTEAWIRNNMQPYLDRGRLTYYRTSEPLYFRRAHSRNMAFRLATGDILCNLDADNFTGNNFASFINQEFVQQPNIFLAADTLNRHYFIRDVCGRICFWRNDLVSTGGFDEAMECYGDEDIDFLNKLRELGRAERVILDMSFLKAIPHDNIERIKHERTLKNLAHLYLSHRTPAETSILFLFKDAVFHHGTLCDVVSRDAMRMPSSADPEQRIISDNERYRLKEKKWHAGTWRNKGEKLFLSDETMPEACYRKDGTVLLNDAGTNEFSEVTNENMIVEAICFHSRITNSLRVVENMTRRQLRCNTSPGCGTVTRNFEHTINVGL